MGFILMRHLNFNQQVNANKIIH